jgi:hypothetical protein
MRYHDREAVQIENRDLRLTVLREGGHIAEILDKRTGVNPLWIPPWRTIEPSRYEPGRYPEYGENGESKLLAGLMGHNLCLDLFGPPSAAEAASGLTVHGEASVLPYELAVTGEEIHAQLAMPVALLRFERILRLEGKTIRVSETVENLQSLDRPIAWTQHVTLGPPFLERGVTRIEHSGGRAQVFGPPAFGESKLAAGQEFAWPKVPEEGGRTVDLSVFSNEPSSAGFTTHLMNPTRREAFFRVSNPNFKIGLRYSWLREDFPWLGMWEENCSRFAPPWDGETMAQGMEFGVSPFPETRREMIERKELFGVPAYRWLEARASARVEYRIDLE